MDKPIAMESDLTGQLVKIYHTNAIGTTPVVPFFLKHYARLIEDGYAHPVMVSTNKSKAVYVTINDEVAGHIVYEIQDDLYKTTWIYFSCVEDKFRKRGLYKIMHRHLENVVKKAGSVKIASFVHVDNIVRQKSCEAVGLKPFYYRMEKDLYGTEV